MREILEKVMSGDLLNPLEGGMVFGAMMDGEISQAMMAAILVALRVRGETPQELATLADVMMERAVKIDPGATTLVDTCGTGGDNQSTLNISTLAALVVAGSGVPVAKHGNRSVSSSCGSADLLEGLGLNITMEPARVEASIREVGFGFLFAPVFHPAMAQAAPVRRELGIRTIFNLLGPLVNPAGVEYQVVGAPSRSAANIVAEAFKLLGKRRVLVIHGMEGLDEVSPEGETMVLEVAGESVGESRVSPSTWGYPCVALNRLVVEGPKEAVERAKVVLGGRDDPAVPAVLMEAALALYCVGAADNLGDAGRMAEDALHSGGAARVLKEAVDFSMS
jgi:anthranilate phosphoribosyltransferase